MESMLIIKRSEDSFEEFINRQIIKSGDALIRYRDIGLVDKRKHPVRLITGILRLRKAISKFDHIIIFDPTKTDIDILRFVVSQEKRVVAWYWNTLSSEYICAVNNINTLINFSAFTFDLNDAKKYKMKFVNQFYFFNYNGVSQLSDTSMGALFIGREKGRLPLLVKLASSLNQIGCAINFRVFVDSESDASEVPNSWKTRDFIDYEKVLELVAEATVVVDFVKENQTGITLRSMEALRYKKKIITNNPTLCNSKFYNNKNVFYFSEDANDPTALRKFINIEYDDTRDEYFKSLYSYEAWKDNLKSQGCANE